MTINLVSAQNHPIWLIVDVSSQTKAAYKLQDILESKYNKHLLGHNREPNVVVGQQLRVLMFVYNIYVCFNGSKFSRFFNIIPPTLEEYLRI
jgi:hypothetical protein